jgi:hypothetical protein
VSFCTILSGKRSLSRIKDSAIWRRAQVLFFEDFPGGVSGHLQPRKPGPRSGAYPAEEFSLFQFHQRNSNWKRLVIPLLSGRITWFIRRAESWR